MVWDGSFIHIKAGSTLSILRILPTESKRNALQLLELAKCSNGHWKFHQFIIVQVPRREESKGIIKEVGKAHQSVSHSKGLENWLLTQEMSFPSSYSQPPPAGQWLEKQIQRDAEIFILLADFMKPEPRRPSISQRSRFPWSTISCSCGTGKGAEKGNHNDRGVDAPSLEGKAQGLSSSVKKELRMRPW